MSTLRRLDWERGKELDASMKTISDCFLQFAKPRSSPELVHKLSIVSEKASFRVVVNRRQI